MKVSSYFRYFALILLIVVSSCKSDDNSDDPTDDGPIIGADNKLPLGESARDLLASETFTSLEVEMVLIEGFSPRAETVANLQTFLEERLNKPGGITINQRFIDPIGDAPYSTAEIIEIEDQVRNSYNTDTTISVFVFFANGANVNDTQFNKTLGTAYRNTSVVIYHPTIQEFSNDPTEPSRVGLETTTLTHEITHLLGLVNLGTELTSDHEDPLNGRHCVVEECLMYFQTEVQGGLAPKMSSAMTASQTTPLDPLCIADLQANGGK